MRGGRGCHKAPVQAGSQGAPAAVAEELLVCGGEK